MSKGKAPRKDPDDKSNVRAAQASQVSLDEDLIQRAAQAVDERPTGRVVTKEFEAHSGPLPPARTLAQYDKVLPGAADRIIAMAEREQAHRMEMNKGFLAIERTNSRLGQVFGLVIGLAAIVGSVVCILYDHDWSGAFLGGSGLSGLVGVFVYGSRIRKAEAEKTAPPKE